MQNDLQTFTRNVNWSRYLITRSSSNDLASPLLLLRIVKRKIRFINGWKEMQWWWWWWWGSVCWSDRGSNNRSGGGGRNGVLFVVVDVACDSRHSRGDRRHDFFAIAVVMDVFVFVVLLMLVHGKQRRR